MLYATCRIKDVLYPDDRSNQGRAHHKYRANLKLYVRYQRRAEYPEPLRDYFVCSSSRAVTLWYHYHHLQTTTQK